MKSKKELRIVVASPSDVRAERESVKAVAEELNGGIADVAGLTLVVKRWEDNAYPGFHTKGPQGLIDAILHIENCEILVGIFWKRFGTPVSDAKGGTEHEFRIAYEAWQKKGAPDLFFYFKHAPAGPATDEEAEQRRLVEEFKAAFPKEGLWWPYKSRAEFEALLRRHLTNFIKHRYLDSPSVAPPAVVTPAAPPPPGGEGVREGPGAAPSFVSSAAKGLRQAASFLGAMLLKAAEFLAVTLLGLISFALPLLFWLALLLIVRVSFVDAALASRPLTVVFILGLSFLIAVAVDLVDNALLLSGVAGTGAILTAFVIFSSLSRAHVAWTNEEKLYLCAFWAGVTCLLTALGAWMDVNRQFSVHTRYLVPGVVAGSFFPPGGGPGTAAVVVGLLLLLVIFIPTLILYVWALGEAAEARRKLSSPDRKLALLLTGEWHRTERRASSAMEELKARLFLNLIATSMLTGLGAAAAYWLVGAVAVKDSGAGVPAATPAAYLVPFLAAAAYYVTNRVAAGMSGEGK